MKGMIDCIVSYLDLPGTKDLMVQDRAAAAMMMDRFHNAARRAVHELYHRPHVVTEHVYCWNDSLLFWAPVGGDGNGSKLAMMETNIVHSLLSREMPVENAPYAVSVMGQSFPGPSLDDFAGNVNRSNQSRYVFLHASSYAFKNCITIEATLGRKHRKTFYVDDRIVRAVPQLGEGDASGMVSMLPSQQSRLVHMYDELKV